MNPHGEAGVVVLDASVMVSRLVSHDLHHMASRRWLKGHAVRGGSVIAPALLLPETVGALSRRTGKPGLANRVIRVLLRIPGLRFVVVDERLGQAAARLAARLGLRGADAVYVAVAEQLKIPLVTWDQEQMDRAGKLVRVFTPGSPGFMAPP